MHPAWLRSIIVAAFVLAVLPPSAPAMGFHGELEARIAAISKRIKRDPGNAGLYLARGDLHLKGRHWRRATADYDRSLSLAPNLHLVHLARARLHLKAGDLERAEASARLFLGKVPEQGEGERLLGRILARAGRPAEAAAALGRALLHIARPRPETWLLRARLLVKADPGNPTQALACLDQGIARLDGAVSLELEALGLERKLKLTDAALRRVARLARRAGSGEFWQVLEAEILEQAGRREAAQRAYESALASMRARRPAVRRRRSVRALMLRAEAGRARTAGGGHR